MNTTLTRIALFTLILIAAGCSSTKFTSTQKAEDIGPVDFSGKKVAALVIHPDEQVRIKAEAALANELTKRGMVGVPANTLISTSDLRDTNNVKSAFRAAGVDGVVVTRLIGVEETVKYVSDFHQPHYGSALSYYDYAWDTVYAPGYYENYQTYVIETLCYRVRDEKLIWSGTSETFAPNSIKALSSSLVKEAGKVMKKQGVVAPKKP